MKCSCLVKNVISTQLCRYNKVVQLLVHIRTHVHVHMCLCVDLVGILTDCGCSGSVS